MTMMFASLVTVVAAVAMRAGLRRRNRRQSGPVITTSVASLALKCPVCGDQKADG